MNSAASKHIPLIFIFTTFVVFLTNYLLLGRFKLTDKVPDIVLYIIYAFIFYFILGYGISASAGLSQCDKIKKSLSTYHGFKTSFIAILTYLVIYFIPFFKAPFNELISDNQLSNSITQIFFISLNLILVSIINYFDSSKKTCEMTQKELEENMMKLDKILNSKEKKIKKKPIIVRD